LQIGVWRLAAMLLCIGFATGVPSMADDVGDDAWTATELAVNAAPVTRVVNTDCDGDWFSFRAYPMGVYTVTGSTGTLWDCTMDVYSSDGTNRLFVTNSAWNGAPVSLQYTAAGSATRMYVRIGGLLEFTTGTYSVAVSEVLTDADHDGMADAWEQQYLGGTNSASSGDADGDRVSNLQEYLAGTRPDIALSRLAITNIAVQATDVRLSWPAVAGGVYVLERLTNLAVVGEAWTGVSIWRQGLTDGSGLFSDTTGGGTTTVYRLRLDY
jgi:hypothetical protein